MSSLIEHMEAHLGRITCGWSHDADGQKLPFQVVELEGNPIPGTRALSTLGLSNTSLGVGDTERRLRQELLLMFKEALGRRTLPGVLQQVGLEALRHDRAYSVGQVIGPRGELLAGSHLEALYVTVPAYLPNQFHVFRPLNGDPIVFGWLIPITAGEAEFIREHGWEAFENEIERLDPDLLDYARSSMF